MIRSLLPLVLLGTLAASCIRYNESSQERRERAQSDPDDDGAERKKKKKKRSKKKSKRPEAAEKLSSLGYVDGTVDEKIEDRGVTVHNRRRAFQGYSFYTSRKQYGAQLIDMAGKVVHRWEVGGTGSWQHATLLPDGDVLVLVKDKQVLRVDKDSNVKWTLPLRAHHDLWVDRHGDIYVLARRRIDAPYHPSLQTVEDYVQVISADGKLKHTVSILKAVENSPYAFLLAQAQSLPARKLNRPNPRPDEEFDILHVNHVEVMDGRFARRDEMFAKGNLLVSPRNLNSILVLDGETAEVRFIWGPNNLVFPHHPTVTNQGNIMVFNNGVKKTGSQVLELDPVTREVVWTYGPVPHFYSVERGSNQRLPNGNTLITESDTGYVFEVTTDGDIVWKFVNPHVKRRTKMRMAIWRMTRHSRASLKFNFSPPP